MNELLLSEIKSSDTHLLHHFMLIEKFVFDEKSIEMKAFLQLLNESES